MNIFKKILNQYDSIMVALIMTGLLITVFFQILYRFTPLFKFSWSLELITYLFSWLTWMGVGIGIQTESHVGVDALVHKLPQKLAVILRVIHLLGFSVLLISLCYFGGKALQGYLSTNKQTPAMHMHYVWYRLPIIVGSISALFRLLQKFVEASSDIKNVFFKESE